MRAARQFLGQAAGVAGLALYNWWVVAAFDRSMLPGPDELFSDLEATGQPYARVLGRVDTAAGLLILIALVSSGRGRAAGMPRTLLLMFAASAVVGGLFPYACAEGSDPSCRTAEWTLMLPWQHYVHVIGGVAEFGAATAAILLLRTQAMSTRLSARIAHRLVPVLVVAYPILAFAYITDTLGAFIEPVFFACFSIAVAVVLFEPLNAGDKHTSTPLTTSEVNVREHRC